MQSGCWTFCRGAVGFVFKFGSNWTNFYVSRFMYSAPFLMRRVGDVGIAILHLSGQKSMCRHWEVNRPLPEPSFRRFP